MIGWFDRVVGNSGEAFGDEAELTAGTVSAARKSDRPVGGAIGWEKSEQDRRGRTVG